MSDEQQKIDAAAAAAAILPRTEPPAHAPSPRAPRPPPDVRAGMIYTRLQRQQHDKKARADDAALERRRAKLSAAIAAATADDEPKESA
jgi:hypothetical protein